MLGNSHIFDSPVKFMYRKLPGFSGSWWPIINLKLGGLPHDFYALIDSGASHSVLHEEIANIVGAKKSSKKESEGLSASGKYKSYETKPIKVSLLDRKYQFSFTVIKNSKGLMWPCILGHDTLFKIAKLEFQSFDGFYRIWLRNDIN